uniref:Uncharacterized protein n=1 Tax=Burkholderia phage vB_BgluM-SURPRISE13 TaxID=3159457 RepID=A0AAU7PG82_9VIRU
MTKQQMLKRSNDQVKNSKRQDIAIFVAFALFVVVPLVWYMTDKLAK